MKEEVRKALDWLVVNAAAHTSPDEAIERQQIIEDDYLEIIDSIKKSNESIAEALGILKTMRGLVDDGK